MKLLILFLISTSVFANRAENTRVCMNDLMTNREYSQTEVVTICSGENDASTARECIRDLRSSALSRAEAINACAGGSKWSVVRECMIEIQRITVLNRTEASKVCAGR